MLALLDFCEVFIIETDASNVGVGAMLIQRGHPLAYINKIISIKHQTLSVYDRELFAIIFAIKKWHQYLVGKHFIIGTDHKPLKFLFDQKVTTPSQFTCLSKLMAYDYEIQYKHGKSNAVANALSRVVSNCVVIHAISSVSTEMLGRIRNSWESDRQLQIKIELLQQGKTMRNYTWVDH